MLNKINVVGLGKLGACSAVCLAHKGFKIMGYDINQKTISLLKKMNIGIIITDHNVKEALSIVEFGYIIYNGEIIKSGNPKEITSDEFVKKIYLGKNYN